MALKQHPTTTLIDHSGNEFTHSTLIEYFTSMKAVLHGYNIPAFCHRPLKTFCSSNWDFDIARGLFPFSSACNNYALAWVCQRNGHVTPRELCKEKPAWSESESDRSKRLFIRGDWQSMCELMLHTESFTCCCKGGSVGHWRSVPQPPLRTHIWRSLMHILTWKT